MQYNKDTLAAQLKTGVHEVTFKKINGETRVMPCTLQENYLPVSDIDNRPNARDTDTLSVWCVDATATGQWRSFRVNNVSGVKQIAECH